jgi:DNA-binding CsgD family transcriptional regulator
MSNPWNLTPQELRAVALLAEVGYPKLVARQMGLAPSTVDATLRSARNRMGVANNVLAAVKYDRAVRPT